MNIEIFTTYKNRRSLFQRSFESLLACTDRWDFRLTVVCDGGGIPDFILSHADCIISTTQNLGLAPAMNSALASIEMSNQFGEGSEFICYTQDDVLYSPGWLHTLRDRFAELEAEHNLGFASGVECIEHPIRADLGDGLLLKDHIRATQMFARREYWMSMWPIPPFDPETGNVRAKPHGGMGSGCDWWFLRDHPNSVCLTGRTNLVIPGLCQHLGYDQSTWLGRHMPESDCDKEKMTR